MWRPSAAVALTLAALGSAGVAQAQATACRPAQDFRLPRVEPARPDAARRTPVTGYTLALSWSPQYCFDARRRGGGEEMQCDGRSGRFGFILHGLWPESSARAGSPQWCRRPTAVPRSVIAANLCRTPSPRLIQHEWTRHGSCMTADPAVYYRAAGLLYDAIRYPDMAALAADRDLDVGRFTAALAAANRGVPARAIRVETRPGGWLEEVRICLDRRFRPADCPAATRGAPAGQRLRIATPA